MKALYGDYEIPVMKLIDPQLACECGETHLNKMKVNTSTGETIVDVWCPECGDMWYERIDARKKQSGRVLLLRGVPVAVIPD